MTGEHRTLREELGAYALGQLSGQRWQAVHAHLEVCVVCRADLEEIAPVAGLLGTVRDAVRVDDVGAGDGGPPPLPPALIEEVRAAAVPSLDERRIRRRGRRWLPAVAAAAAAAVLAGGIGYVVGDAARGPRIPTEAVAVRALAPGIQAEAALIDHTWGMEMMLVASGFGAGESYTVTVTDDAGNTVGAGEFVGTGEAQMRCNLNSSILRDDASLVQVIAPDGEVVLDAAV